MTILKQASGAVGTAEKKASLYFKKPNTSEQAKETQSSESGSDSSGSESECTTESETDGETATVPLRGGYQSVPPTRARNIVTAAPQVATSRVTQVNTQREDAAKKARKEIPWTICLSHCRYEIVRSVARRYGLHEVDENEQWNIYWTDYSVSIERAMDMRRFQLINHFPGMNEICRKDLLARNLNRMKRLFGKDFDIYPKTWSLPGDLAELQNYALCRRNKIYICKPEMGCQGRGIFLIRNIKDLNPFGRIVCQLYLAKPFLIDNYKFDLRLYVLITSCDPFRVYLYKEGLARFATARYKPPTNNNNTENSYMHLTNYAVNKFSRDYIVDDDCGSKRRLTSVWKWLNEHGHNVEAVCEEIDDVIIKTILSAGPILKQNYNYCFPDRTSASACFEILGFDIIFDHKLKPYVLEVNHSPSFHTDARLDLEIKEGLLDDTFAMVNFKHLARPKMRPPVGLRATTALNDFRESQQESIHFNSEMQAAHELSNCGGFRLIYSSQTNQKYDRYFAQHSTSGMEGKGRNVTTAVTNKIISDIKPVSSSVAEEEPQFRKEATGTNLKDSPPLPSARTAKPQNLEAYLQSLKPMVTPMKKPVPVLLKLDSFTSNFIKPEEELERTKAIMQRGMLIRSLGIEKQVYRLLKDLGSVKAEEEKLYQRLYGSCEAPTREMQE